MSKGHVYFIEAEASGHVKIGWSKHHPGARLSELQTGCPDHLFLRAYMVGTLEDERRMHRTFDAFRCRGEWFAGILKLRDFLDYVAPLDDGDVDGAPLITPALFRDALHDCVKQGMWGPNRDVSERIYDESADWTQWAFLLDHEEA